MRIVNWLLSNPSARRISVASSMAARIFVPAEIPFRERPEMLLSPGTRFCFPLRPLHILAPLCLLFELTVEFGLERFQRLGRGASLGGRQVAPLVLAEDHEEGNGSVCREIGVANAVRAAPAPA